MVGHEQAQGKASCRPGIGGGIQMRREFIYRAGIPRQRRRISDNRGIGR